MTGKDIICILIAYLLSAVVYPLIGMFLGFVGTIVLFFLFDYLRIQASQTEQTQERARTTG